MMAVVVQNSLEKELHVGAAQQDIENFFKRHSADFSWDPILVRYQAVIRDKDDPQDRHAVVIHIYVDREGRFLRAEVRDSYT